MPPRLHKALDAKRIGIEPTDDVYAALANLCRLSRDTSVSLPILAIVEPDSVTHAAELAETASIYAPKAVLWVYSSSPHEQIREIREADLASWRGGLGEQSATSVRTESGGGTVKDRTGSPTDAPDSIESGSSVSHTESPGPSQEPGSNPGAILTDEELEMLLADDLPTDED